MQAAAVYVLGGLSAVLMVGLFAMRIAGVPMAEQIETVKELSPVIGLLIGLGAWFRATQANAKADDNRQGLGVAARVAVDGFAGPPAAKAEAIKNLNGLLPATGSVEAKRPDAVKSPNCP